MVLFLLKITLIQITFTPKHFSLDNFAPLAILFCFEFANITINSTNTIVCHIILSSTNYYVSFFLSMLRAKPIPLIFCIKTIILPLDRILIDVLGYFFKIFFIAYYVIVK